MQYPVIYAIYIFCCCVWIVIAPSIIVLAWWKEERKKSEDRQFACFSDLPVWHFSNALQWRLGSCCLWKHSRMTDMAHRDLLEWTFWTWYFMWWPFINWIVPTYGVLHDRRNANFPYMAILMDSGCDVTDVTLLMFHAYFCLHVKGPFMHKWSRQKGDHNM